MDKSLDISVVVPLYNERESLAELVAWIDRVARENNLSYEIIMVDDGSRDGSWQEIERLSALYPAIRAIRFARNYGKSAALYCGFERPRERWSSRWMPTFRIRPTRFPRCGA